MPRLGASLAEVSTVIVPISTGAHVGKIKNVEQKKTKENNLPMVVVETEITEGEFKGRSLFDYMVLQTKAGEPNESGLRSLKRLGIATVGEDRIISDDFDTDELIGQPVEVVVTQENYEDKDSGETQISNRVKKYVPIR